MDELARVKGGQTSEFVFARSLGAQAENLSTSTKGKSLKRKREGTDSTPKSEDEVKAKISQILAKFGSSKPSSNPSGMDDK